MVLATGRNHITGMGGLGLGLGDCDPEVDPTCGQEVWSVPPPDYSGNGGAGAGAGACDPNVSYPAGVRCANDQLANEARNIIRIVNGAGAGGTGAGTGSGAGIVAPAVGRPPGVSPLKTVPFDLATWANSNPLPLAVGAIALVILMSRRGR